MAQLPAFPGAEGYGRYATGGRGGAVFEVTNLNDSGEGSLRAAIQATGPRTIIFRLSGTIHLKSSLKVSNGNLTIAGQTAPGDGICIASYPFRVEAANVIIRHIRFRMGDLTLQDQDGLSINESERVIIDHCSISWGIDETSSCYSNTDFTMQYCIISESFYNSIHPKGLHGYGGIWGGSRASFHHNLLAHHTSRLPRFNGARYNTSWDELVDHRNNVIYNWGFNSAYGGEPSELDGNKARINMVKNYYKAGPATRTGEMQYRIVSPDPDPVAGYSYWYIDSNAVWGYPDVFTNNWGLGVQGVTSAEKEGMRSDNPFPWEPVTEQMPEQAYDTVLSSSGAILPGRDTLDKRIIWEVINDTALYGGSWGSHSGIIDSQNDVGGWPQLFTGPAPADSDHDGMPDIWETAHGLNPADPQDRNGDSNGNGYTNLEEYLNSITEFGDFIIPPTDLRIDLTGINEISLYWTDNTPDEDGYYIERADTGNFEVIDTLEQDVISYIDSLLEYSTEYHYRVRAFNSGDTSVYTSVLSAMTLESGSVPQKATLPSPVHYQNNVSLTPVLTWRTGAGTSWHAFYFGQDNPPPFYGNLYENKFSPDTLEAGAAYYWRVDEVNNNGTATGQVWKFITEQPSSYFPKKDLNAWDLQLAVYPNPVRERTACAAYIIPKASEAVFTVNDLSGREILRFSIGIQEPGNHRYPLHLKELDEGIYILHVKTKYSSGSLRLVVL
jgi:hypothetical protein